jgi:hypothetical protein
MMTSILGLTTFAVWLFVEDHGQIVMYYSYIIGYTGVLIFQVGRVNPTPYCDTNLYNFDT